MKTRTIGPLTWWQTMRLATKDVVRCFVVNGAYYLEISAERMTWKYLYGLMTPDQRDTLRGALAFADEFASQRLRDKFHAVWEELDDPSSPGAVEEQARSIISRQPWIDSTP